MLSLVSRLTALPRSHPFAFGVGISCAKTVAADATAQLYVEGRETLDRRRSAVFAVWGACYLGGVQYFIYVTLFARYLFPSAAKFVAKPVAERLADRAGQLTVLKQVALDQFVHHPFVLFPTFYCVKESIEQHTFNARVARTALAKYRTNAVEDLKACWGTWVPAFLFNFSINPLWARIPFVAVVSFGFTTYMSFLRGKPQTLPSADETRS